MFKSTFINKIFFLVIVLVTHSIVFITTTYPQNKLTHFEHITQDQGLSSNSILAILQDRKGFLWIATEFGLNRYDGLNFKTYQYPAIPSNTVACIYEDESGNLWAGTANGGLVKYLPDQDKFIDIKIDSLKKTDGNFLYLLDILEDKEHLLWIATPEALIKIDPKTNNSNAYFQGRYVSKACQDKQGNFWVITSYQETFTLVNFDPLSGKSLAEITIGGLSNAEYSALAYHPDGSLFVGTPNGLYVINTTTKEIVSHYDSKSNGSSKLPSDNVTCLYFLDNNTLWLGTNNQGFAELNLQTQKITPYQHDPKDTESLIGNHISTIYKDRSGVFWIGDKVYGLNKLSPYKNLFRLYRNNPFNENSLSNNYIRGIFEDSNGLLWVATQFGGLNKINRVTNQVTHYQYNPEDPKSLPNTVWAVYEDHKGVLWVGTSPDGLYIYDRSKDIFIKTTLLPNPVKETHVNVIYEDSIGNLLVGTRDGLYKIKPNRDLATILYNRYDPNTKDWQVGFDIQSIFEDSQHNIWVGTDEGILKFNSQNYQNHTIYRKEISSEKSSNTYINSFIEDYKGIIWIATKGLGILRFDPKTNQFDIISKASGLAHINTYGILSDNKKTFWISTDNGIAHYIPTTNSFETFGVSDGLQGKEFNRRAFFKSSSGELFFGGVNGLNSFYPDLIIKNPTPPPVFITSVIASGKSLLVPTDSSSNLELNYTDKSLTIDFAALDFNAPENNLYSYKLSDFDKDWIQTQGKNEVTYTNLAPGTYIFQVKGTNNHQVWSPKASELKIIIFPPPWRTTWAYLFYLLLITSTAVFSFRYYTNKLKLQANIQAERLRAETAEVQARALERENQQRVQNEAQIKLKNSELEEANLKLKQLDEIKAKFTAMLVHDLKSPLTVINSTLEILSGHNTNSDEKVFLQTSQKSVKKIVNMVNEVLEFYQASSEEMKFNFEVTNLLELLTYCVEEAKISATAKNISVTLNIKGELPLISADISKLDRAFNNLLSNAIKFTPNNGQIFIKAWTNKEAMESDLPLLYISIADTGEGIATEELPYIFEPYHQASSSNKQSGVGLGLATVKGIISAHNGNISVDSQVGKGTCFTITLPTLPSIAPSLENKAIKEVKLITQNSKAERETLITVPNSPPSENLKEQTTKKILVVDDEIINQKIVASKLKTMGYQVDTANNGLEAVNSASANSYDLILLDHYMPEMDGLQAAKEIRRQEINGKHIPIIFFTADSTQVPNSKDIVDDIIEKPFNAKQLEETIKLWI